MSTPIQGSVGRYWNSKPIRSIGAKYNIVFGTFSRGKTYDMIYNAIEHYWTTKDVFYKQTYYLRQTEEMLKSACPTCCDTVICNGKNENTVLTLTEGKYNNIIYYRKAWYLAFTKDGIVKEKDKIPFMLAGALSGYMKSKGSGNPHCDVIWCEEFVPEKGFKYLKSEFSILMKWIKLIVRDRRDFTVWLTGNSVDKYSPYFDGFGLTHIREQKEGTIEVYNFGKTNVKIAVEFTAKNDDAKTTNDEFFALDNPDLRMLAEGGWDTRSYPKIEKPLYSDICGTFWIIFKGAIIECDIVSNEENAFIYMHQDIDPLIEIDYDYDIIYTPDYNPKPNYRRSFDHMLSEPERIICMLIKSDKLFFDEDSTGGIYEGFIERSKTL